MPKNNNSRFETDIERSIVTFIFIILGFLGVTATFLVGVPSGEVFWIIISSSIVALVFFFFFVKEKEFSYIEYPFSRSLFEAEFNLFTGIGFVVIVNLFVHAISKFSIHEIIRPFIIYSAAPGEITGHVFNVIQIQLDPFWASFFTVFVAGIEETWVFNFVCVVLGVLLGLLIIRLIGQVKQSLKEKRLFTFIIALIFSSIIFAVAHFLNGTYQTPSMFISAAVFLLVMNLLLYVVNFNFLFAAGFHMANNAFALGIGTALSGFITTNPIGILIDILFISMFIHFIVGIFKGKIQKEVIPNLEFGL